MGDVLPAPRWLTDLLSTAPEMTAPASGDLNTDDDDGINKWSANKKWADYLIEDGFTATGDVERCGCPTWTRPGGTHEKSAVAHTPGCGRFDTSTGHGPIHAWSDALSWGGKQTVSLLTYLAVTRYAGDTSAAMRDLGIASKPSSGGDDLFVLGEASSSSAGTDDDGLFVLGSAEGKGNAPDTGATHESKEESGGALEISVVEFWNQREVFTHIRNWAIAAYVSPWAMLGSVLAYVSALTPPRVTLPDEGSLSLFVGLVGKPGVGKDRARGAAYKWMRKSIEASGLEQRAVGSGQGIGALYIRKIKERGGEDGADRFATQQIRESAMLTIPEIDAVYAHAKQQASTLVDTLRSAWMAEPLGGAYKDVQRDISVPAGVYRLCLIAGIQPSKARTLLEDATGGLPQRFLWMPATDPTLPMFEYGEKPAYPEPWEWKPPVRLREGSDPFTLGGEDTHDEPGIEIVMCETALREQHYLSMAKVRDEYTGDDLSTHDMFGRMRVAAALALLDGRTEVTDEDWTLSATVMAVSNYVRGKVVAGIAREDQKKREVEQQVAVETAVAMEKATATSALDRATNRVRDLLAAAGGEWVGTNVIRRGLSRPARAHFEDATAHLITVGLVEKEEGNGGVRYRLKK